MITTIKTTVEIELTVEMAAKWYAGLDDEAQADFFEKVAQEAEKWESSNMAGQEQQWWYVGRHLATCKCITSLGREMVENLYRAMVWREGP